MSLPPPDPALESQSSHRHDRAFAYLKGLLLDGGLEPGQVISTEDVASALSISRAPATDAIKRLVRDGFITVIPQVGCRVCVPAPTEVDDFYRLFARSEALITGLAAERRTSSQAAAFERLAAEIDRGLDALRGQPDMGADRRALNRRRYEAIHRMAGSGIAASLVANMWDRSDFYIRIAYGAFVYAPRIHQSNRVISRAIVDGDATTASRETEGYLLTVGGQTAARLDLAQAAEGATGAARAG